MCKVCARLVNVSFHSRLDLTIVLRPLRETDNGRWQEVTNGLSAQWHNFADPGVLDTRYNSRYGECDALT